MAKPEMIYDIEKNKFELKLEVTPGFSVLVPMSRGEMISLGYTLKDCLEELNRIDLPPREEGE